MNCEVLCMITINNILEDLKYLRLNASYNKALELLTSETSTEIKNIIYEIINSEVKQKEENNRLYNVKIAGFPYLKTFEDFDFEFQPTINEEQIRSIANSKFYEHATNIAFIGSPGVGKTHLAIATGITVAKQRVSVYFIKFNKLISNLVTAFEEGKLEAKLKVYNKYKLLIIDEIGFNELTYTEAKLFFQLVDLRYEKRATIYTSNIGFERWIDILGKDEMITRAILDRILHHSHLFNIVGNSYRIKDKMRIEKRDDE